MEQEKGIEEALEGCLLGEIQRGSCFYVVHIMNIHFGLSPPYLCSVLLKESASPPQPNTSTDTSVDLDTLQ